MSTIVFLTDFPERSPWHGTCSLAMYEEAHTRRALKTVIVILVLGSISAYCETPSSSELKSTGVAWLLALDPIPGDALFYAGKPVQGTINLVVGLPMGLAFWAGIAIMATTDMNAPISEPEDYYLAGLGIAVLGAVVYLPILVWDAVGGITGVVEHNAKIRQRTTFLRRVQPMIAIHGNNAWGGVRIAF